MSSNEATNTAVLSDAQQQVLLDSFSQPKPGLLVTAELEKAIEECRAKVRRIVKECRARNLKFRDVEFDLENDQYRCLHGLDFPATGKYVPSDVQRVTQIFDNPQFFVDGADSNDIIQGKLGDCWFLSALATVSTAKGLVEKFCRDEQVGVYGFIFFRDNSWVNVVIDDMLYTSVPKWEELTTAEMELYHGDKVQYNNSARKGGKTLYFAKSGMAGETWVPLIEKAYAKLHGDYVSLSGGKSLEAVEDLTGGVSTAISNKDILDTDRFWNEELLKANRDRLFGCSFDSLDSNRSGIRDAKVDGLIGSHAYSVLRAVECRGKRFVVLRNPWGKSEWTGRWSDGLREWTPAWLEILPLLDHEFGDDGQFVMEYCDFLEVWDQIHRTILFDSSWVMSSQWLQVHVRPLPSSWSHGDVVFTFSLPKRALTIVVLSQIDVRYFKEIAGTSSWCLDFTLVKRGDLEPIAESSSSLLYSRSVNLEMELDEGEYNVYVRIDRTTFKDPRYLPTDLSTLIRQDCEVYERQKVRDLARKRQQEEEEEGVETVTVTVTTTTTTTTTRNKNPERLSTTHPVVPIAHRCDSSSRSSSSSYGTPLLESESASIRAPSPAPLHNRPRPPPIDTCVVDPGHSRNMGNYLAASPKFRSFSPIQPPPRAPAPEAPPPLIEIAEDENSVYLGLRVYTQNTTAVVGGLLYHEIPGMGMSPPGTRPVSPI
ncbi:hypothetical protein H0H81_001370 [Sphagnurus paluster]|uniref:Calpain catalytic domain-containing protein n=1 Tax=Sphagnurus paluster TaxID=117069 RepID=A0A9P7GMB8_9AGAR|nr:hypothetical protein H0H81_001370 [Sphagnurus paluster]